MARVIADELARGGMSEAVVAPGSRSAALAIALDRQPGIRVHVRIDERSAGFLALGMAKVSGVPVAVVCTSGTAVANLHPAVLEAAYSGVPLMVLSADRPPELRGTGVNQTVDQGKLFGEAVGFYAELAVPDMRIGMVAYWRSVVSRGLAVAAQGHPAHLNIPFRVPVAVEQGDDWIEPLDGRTGGAPWTVVGPTAAVEVPVPELDDPPERGLLVVGDSAPDVPAAVAFAEAVGWPVLSEPTGNARNSPNAVTTYAHLLAVQELAAELKPEFIVTVGRVGLVRQLLALYPTVPNLVVSAASRWPDPTRTALRVTPSLPAPPHPPRASAWLETWLKAETVARRALDQALDRDELTELRLARDLVALAGPDALLFTGSSLPIRHLDAAGGPGPRIVGNRGVSGIDGCVSTAVGMALAHQARGGGRVFALLGDLTLVHDQNGLVIGPDEARPDLTVVVVNNGGGGIFATMSYARVPASDRLFGAVHTVDFAHMAAMSGWRHQRVSRAAELADALTGRSTRLVEVVTDRTATAAHLHSVRAAVAAALTC
ncbi:2-succinyl-5-enolpyruvyl-6-hydroxy-3-cyclohexene-1-carboxylic-acid synthase [Amycolatopsis sp. KNN50.9b]|nr:2-succinyl-5-enolpyruvyl-6-hydroxy-3-cyclohexene-1-carboxylic-acid synthase [Amycolatopsis sp. KNN50.9b]